MIALVGFYWWALLLAFGIGLLTARWTWFVRPLVAPVAFDPYDEPIDWPLASAPQPPPADPRPAETPAPVAVDEQPVEPLPEMPLADEPQPIAAEGLAAPDIAPAPESAPEPEPEHAPEIEARDDAAILANAFRPVLTPPDVQDPVPPAEQAVPPSEPGSKAPDDLLQLKGVGPGLARLLNSLGVHRFDDIASWTPEDIEMIDSHLGMFRGRIIRDEWIQQARLLAAGDMDGFNARYGHIRF